MALPFRRKDTAEVFFDLDILDTATSSTASSNKSKKPTRQNPRATLLGLPLEIRLQIYDLLLVGRFDRAENPSWAVGKTHQKLVLLHMQQMAQYRTMEPAILQTCRQVYSEALPVLYSRNVFAVSGPEQMFELAGGIGPANLRLVRSLEIWVPWAAELEPWLDLLDLLAEKATGLRDIKIGLDGGVKYPWKLAKGARERGLGDNVLFVRALARIRGLERLKITGFYARQWPSYLEEKLGIKVQAECGHCVDSDAPDAETRLWRSELNEKNMSSFMEYQEGIGDMFL